MKPISIERLLQWAYADERVRGMPAWGDTPGGGLSGSRGKHHDDALTVDQCVSGLSTETAALLRDHGVARTQPDFKPMARYRLAPVRWVEVKTEGGSSELMGQWFETHPQRVLRRDRKRGLVEHQAPCRCNGHSHLCGLPESSVPAFKRGEKVNAAGDPLPPPYVPVVEVDRPADVDAARTIYVRWWSGLMVIRDELRLRARLVAHRLTDELPPLRPWAAKQPKIHYANFSVDGTIAPM